MSDGDPAATRAFFTDGLKSKTSTDDWAQFVKALDTATGPRGQVYVHDVSWYARETLVAAIDFSQPFVNGSGTICGYVVWTVPTLDQIEVSRVEQNIVSPSELRAMPVQEAAQLMTSWRCPVPLIEDLLGISLQKK